MKDASHMHTYFEALLIGQRFSIANRYAHRTISDGRHLIVSYLSAGERHDVAGDVFDSWADC